MSRTFSIRAEIRATGLGVRLRQICRWKAASQAMPRFNGKVVRTLTMAEGTVVPGAEARDLGSRSEVEHRGLAERFVRSIKEQCLEG